jgi:hypothetical protein
MKFVEFITTTKKMIIVSNKDLRIRMDLKINSEI